MSTVTVFVDDAVQGHLPMVGATDGAPGEGLHRIQLTVGGASGWLWLLIFLGPIGWVLLIAFSAFNGGRRFVVRLPYTHEALRSERAKFRAAVGAGAVMVVAALVAFLFVMTNARSRVEETLMVLAAVIAIAAAVVTIVSAIRYSLARPAIELDASGRWVTLRGVHPAFAEACAAAAPRRADIADRR